MIKEGYRILIQEPVDYPIPITGIFVFILVVVIMILCCGYSNRGGRAPFRVTRTRPKEKVDGLIGLTTTDYSYTDGKGGALPVGFSTTPEREKPETYEIHKSKHADATKKETEE